jgi:hypothetical protein
MPLKGTVLGPGGEPVVGAELILVGLPSYDAPVVARAKSGEGGRFSLDRPVALAGDHHPQRAPILWALKPGLRASAMRFPEALPEADQAIRIVLEAAGKAEVRVAGPQGQPIVGVEVRPGRLKTHYTNVPEVVAAIASATTGPDGVAVIDAVAPEELAYVDVHSRELGIQGRPISPKPGKPAVVVLRPASSWKGRLTAKDPRHARGWRVRAWTQVAGDPSAEPETTGYVETTTDIEGRFALAPIAVGGLQLELTPPADLPVLADLPRSLAVREGREDTVDISLKSTVIVTGLFLEKGNGKPVPGISATLIYIGGARHGSQTVQTDERGRYTFKSLPGLVRVGHFHFPATHVQAPSQGWEDFTVPEPPKVIELATREALRAAPPLRGQVVDEAGQAVPGATVQAAWVLSGARGQSSGSIQTKADDEGRFVLEGLGPGSNVSITARRRERQSKGPVEVQAGDAGPVKVAITPMPVLALAGRLLGPGGAPLGGIPVKVQFRVPRDNFPGFPQDAQFEDNVEIKTGPDGAFRTPKELERKPSEFRIVVAAADFLPARTVWVPVPDGDLLRLPDLALKRAKGFRIVSGRVVDRDGRAVSGASVSQAGDGPRWTSATVDAGGRFRLSGVSDGKALVFAEAPGFRYGGTIIGGGADPVEIRLARAGEPPIATYKSLPSPLLRAEERRLARELLGPLLPLAQSGSLGNVGASVIPALARVDPARVLEMIENRAVAEPSSTLIQVALGEYEDDPALAMAVIQDDLDPSSRAAAWLALSDFRPHRDRARRESLLDRALADARQAKNAGLKIKLLGEIADRWLELGSIDRARPILLEGQRIVMAWPGDTWFFEAEEFAEALAVIDLPAAIAVFERQGKTNVSPTDASTLNRHKGRAAIRLASVDPAAAEGLIAPPSANFHDRAEIVLMVCRKMVNADLSRARRLLETIDGESGSGRSASRALVSFGLGAIAGELAKTNPIQARGLLDEAFAGLRKFATDDGPGQGQDAVANLMAELLPIVERLDPERLVERTWLVAASRPPSVQEQSPRELEGTFALAMRVARYDRAIADLIASAGIERLPDLFVESIGSYDGGIPALLKNLTAYDPRAIAALLRSLPDAVRKPPHRYDNWTPPSIESQLRLAAAQILGFPNQARPREAGRSGNDTLLYRVGD